MVGEELAEGLFDLGRVSHVKSDGTGVSTRPRMVSDGLGCWFERAVVDDHMSPTVGENIGDGATQAAPRACDHGDLARQVLLI